MWTAREPRGQGEPRPANMVEAAGSRDPPASGSEGRAAAVRGQHGGDSGREAERKGLKGESGGETADGRARRGSAAGAAPSGREQDGEDGLTCHGGLRAAMALGAAAPLPSVSTASAVGPGGPRQAEHGAGRGPLRPHKMARPWPRPRSLRDPPPWRPRRSAGETAWCSLREKRPAAGACA